MTELFPIQMKNHFQRVQHLEAKALKDSLEYRWCAVSAGLTND